MSTRAKTMLEKTNKQTNKTKEPNHSTPKVSFIYFTLLVHLQGISRAVIKSQGPQISPGYYECGPWLLSLENRRKIEPKETPSCLIARLLVVFTQQLEILGLVQTPYFSCAEPN